MKKILSLVTLFILATSFSNVIYAQILEDEDNSIFEQNQPTNKTVEDDALFDELFSDFPDTEKDITQVKTFDDVVSRASAQVKTQNNDDSSSFVMSPQQLPPLTGDMYIGITKNSFKVFKDMAGRTKCKFSVTLKSNLDRSIKIMGLSLVYPKTSFAFIFKEVPANGKQVHYITTTDNICYTIAGVPDIDIHKCKIRGATGEECAQRLKWSDDME